MKIAPTLPSSHSLSRALSFTLSPSLFLSHTLILSHLHGENVVLGVRLHSLRLGVQSRRNSEKSVPKYMYSKESLYTLALENLCLRLGVPARRLPGTHCPRSIQLFRLFLFLFFYCPRLILSPEAYNYGPFDSFRLQTIFLGERNTIHRVRLGRRFGCWGLSLGFGQVRL